MKPLGIRLALIVVSMVALRTIDAPAGFVQTNLVSDVPGLANNTDPGLKNPWGVSFGPNGPFWVSDQASGLATLYDQNGTKQGLVVSVPGTAAGSQGSPTGQVFNGTSDFGGNLFIFSTLNGTIAGWKPADGTTAATLTTVAGAAYTGLASGNDGTRNLLYAANARGGVDVFDSSLAKTTVPGGFIDPNGIPTGFTAFNVQNLKGNIYVTYANRLTSGGIVDEFDTNGNFISRIAANAPGGALDQPWGLALAPAGFGPFGGDLLVGNKVGDSAIHAYDPTTGQLVGTLTLDGGQVFSEANLWALTFGGGGKDGDPNTLYFTAGINGEVDGLFGSISFLTPEPSTLVSVSVGGVLFVVALLRLRLRRPAATA